MLKVEMFYSLGKGPGDSGTARSLAAEDSLLCRKLVEICAIF